jgi:protein-S-isoprenylcysteine O-methyltransferase Ste14
MRFRPARPAPAWWNIAKTLGFLLLFWFMFLFVVPIALSTVEIELGIQRFPPLLRSAGIALVVFGVLGIWAAITLAVVGQGTPAPFDTPRRLVTSGPYAYVRNPLVIAAIGLGVAIGVVLGSVPVLAYITLSLLIWYAVVRPAEERDLARRFGESWSDYAQSVRAFRPRLTPYRPK